MEKDFLVTPSNILFLTQRSSDFVEMQRAAIGLKQYGHRCLILFCGVDSKIHDDRVIEKINHSINVGEIDGKIIFSPPTIILDSPIHRMIKRFWERGAQKAKQRVEETPVVQHKYDLVNNSFTKKLSILKRFFLFRLVLTASRWLMQISFRLSVDIGRKAKRSLRRLAATIKSRLMTIIKENFRELEKFIHSDWVVLPAVYRRHLQTYEEILSDYDINLIILPEDVVGPVTPLLIKAGHNHHIPSMIIPYTIANQTETFQALKARPDVSLKKHISHRLIGIFFPSWVMKDSQYAVLRLPAPHILGHVLTRSSPPDPWMMNSGYANIIAVENKKMLQYYLRSGIPASKMKISGACSDDKLASLVQNKVSEREQLYKELNIQTTKPLLLMAGFPNQLKGGNPPGFDFANIEDAVNFIGHSFDELRKEYEIIFKPHPNDSEIGELFSQLGWTITHVDTAKLVALSDLYVAFASATIRWAIACGVPTINYDIFYYNFADFKQVKGVLNVNSKDGFKHAVQKFSQQEELLSLRHHLDTEKTEWGYLDGRSIERIHVLTQELIQSRKVSRRTS